MLQIANVNKCESRSVLKSVRMEENLNFIDLLLHHDLTGLCYQVFCELDSQSLANCRLVCQTWKHFIDHHFFNLPKGRKHVKHQIVSNIFNERYSPRIKKVEVPSLIFDIHADKHHVFIATEAGGVIKYDFHTLEHEWTLQTELRHECLQIDVTSDKVFAVTSGHRGHVIIIDR